MTRQLDKGDFPANLTGEPLLLSTDEAARVLGTSARTVRRMIALGTLDAIRLTPNGHPKVRRADLEALITKAA